MAAYRSRADSPSRPIVRSSGMVQLGATGGSEGILLAGLSADELALLDRLAGGLSETELYAAARATGVPHRRAGELLAVLRQHGVLLADRAETCRPGQKGRLTPASRSDDRVVVVDGTGPLAVAVASVLRASGVGQVRAGAWAADAVEAELRLTGSEGPDLVVLVAQGAVDPRAGEPWRRRAVAHLPVVQDRSRIVVGPWITGDPGQPCLRCLLLTRDDRDRQRPTLSLAVATDASDEPLVAMGAGMAAMVASAGLRGRTLPAGISVEVRPPWPNTVHRRWSRHTDCQNHEPAPAQASRVTR
jgi:hypothetical protein